MPTQTRRRPARAKSSKVASAPRSTTVKPRGSATRTTREQVEAAREEIVFETGGGNVFADIGAHDADARLAKAELARIVRALVRARVEHGSTQGNVARELGIAASDLSDLMRGKLRRFSQDRITRYLTRLGMRVVIQVGPARGDRAEVIVEEVAVFG